METAETTEASAAKTTKERPLLVLSEETALSPVDGRYWGAVCGEALAPFLSERALMRYRALVEVEYFVALWHTLHTSKTKTVAAEKELSAETVSALRAACTEEGFSERRAFSAIKALERTLRHDVKAVERWTRGAVADAGLCAQACELVHFGLTSQDVNNTALPLALRDALCAAYGPALGRLLAALVAMAQTWRDVPMLARTHGQPATPTRVGKELFVFAERICDQRALLCAVPIEAKFGGATGGLNAHYAAFPTIDWVSFADAFVAGLPSGIAPSSLPTATSMMMPLMMQPLRRQRFTTQIEHYDSLAALFDALRRINVVLLDLARDMWTYISLGYFVQAVNKDEVGSSAMPHKVNPIDFENAEGNIGVANALFGHFSEKLPVSRMQRDLSDSTVLRNVGVALGHTLVAINSLERGLAKLSLDERRVAEDLDANWAVLAEPIQTILRREGYPEPYDALKQLTRREGAHITREDIVTFIKELRGISEDVRAELLRLSPSTYIGVCPEFVLP